MKKLVSNCKPNYCSEIVVFNGNKFKIVCENGNAYSKLNIEILTKNGDLGLSAIKHDIPNYKDVWFGDNDEKRLKLSMENIVAAEEFIKAVYGDTK